MTKPLDIIPAAGPLDTRSPAALVPFGSYRFIRNWFVDTENNLCREPGFDKLLTNAEYNNEDLHDQLRSQLVVKPEFPLDAVTGLPSRLPVTMLFQAESTRKTTKLIAGTARAIYALNNGTGNWKILADQFGSSDSSRWRTPAQLLDTVLFTNNEDPPQYWQFDQGITEANNQSVAEIPDLRDIIKITKVGVVISWKDHLFLMNVVVDGAVRSNSIFWCNYQHPLDWIPSEGSTAGSADIDYGETILAALPMGSRLLIYSNRGIWELNAVGGEAVFSLAKRYAPASFERCLFYPRSLVSDGDSHIFCGVDAIYFYSVYQVLPQQVDWVHKTSGWMFKHMRKDTCDLLIGAYETKGKRVMFSFAREGEIAPMETLVLTPEHKFAQYRDHGFLAAVNYVYRATVEVLRNFLLEKCVCTTDQFAEFFGSFVKEGSFCRPQEAIACPNPPTSIWTVNSASPEEGIEHEDWDQASADPNSLCAQLGNLTLNQLCENSLRQDECSFGLRFVFADSVDYCIKESSENLYRERCIDFSGCGGYVRLGYKSLLRTGPLDFGDHRNIKLVERFEAECDPAFQTIPSQIRLRIGAHARALDLNDVACPINMETQPALELECLSAATVAQMKQNNILPDQKFAWPVWNEGQFLFFEVEIFNDKVSPENTGGAVCLSRFSLDVSVKKRSYV